MHGVLSVIIIFFFKLFMVNTEKEPFFINVVEILT